MKSLILLLTLASVALASVELRHQNEVIEDDKPKRCCLPKTFQVNVGGSEAYDVTGTSIHGVVRFFAQYGFISSKEVAAVRIMTPPTYMEIQRLVMDFKKQILYNVTGSSCVKSRFQAPMPDMCLPASATYLASSYFGGGRDMLRFDVWQVKNSTLNLEETVTFTKNCYPLSTEADITIGQVRAFITSGYTEMKDRIEDPSLFTIPESCENSVVFEDISHQHLPKSIFMRF